MPSKSATVPNAVLNTKLLSKASGRILFSIFLPIGQGEIYIYDEQQGSAGMYYLQEGQIIVFSKADGDDTEKEWFANSSASIATPTVLIFERFT